MNKLSLIFLLCILFLTSCGVTNKLTSEQKEYLSYEIAIDQCINEGNILKLIELYSESPNHRQYIEDYIEYTYDFSEIAYNELVSIRNIVADSTLRETFNQLVDTREDMILDSISNFSVSELGVYYKEHPDEQFFIRPMLDSIIDINDYRQIKLFRKSFTGTDIEKSLDSAYLSLREQILPEAEKTLDNYFKKELLCLQNIKTDILLNIRSKLEDGLPYIIEEASNKINRDFFDKIFKSNTSDKYTIEEYTISLVDKYYNKSLDDVANYPILSFIETINNNRLNFIQYYLDDDIDTTNIYVSKFTPQKISTKIPLENIKRIQEIKDQIDWISWGMLALSFIPGAQPVALAIDAIDILYSYFADKKETKEINANLEQFSKKLLNSYNNNSKNTIENNCEIIRERVFESQNQLKNIFYENF